MLPLLGLLIASNVFMTLAWFLHLRHPEWPLWQAVLLSWLIAALEYAIAIPAVRAAHERGISAATIKIAQEAVTLLVFAAVIALVLSHAGLSWRFVAASVLLLGAVAVTVTG